jgi:hypothetical protein
VDFQIISASSDPYKPPKGVKTNRFKIGDKVVTPEGYEGVVIDIESGYYDRADTWQRRRMYRLDLPTVPGSPRVCFAGWELERDAEVK